MSEQFSSAAVKRMLLHMSVEYWVKDNLGLEGNDALNRATDVMNFWIGTTPVSLARRWIVDKIDIGLVNLALVGNPLNLIARLNSVPEDKWIWSGSGYFRLDKDILPDELLSIDLVDATDFGHNSGLYIVSKEPNGGKSVFRIYSEGLPQHICGPEPRLTELTDLYEKIARYSIKMKTNRLKQKTCSKCGSKYL